MLWEIVYVNQLLIGSGLGYRKQLSWRCLLFLSVYVCSFLITVVDYLPKHDDTKQKTALEADFETWAW